MPAGRDSRIPEIPELGALITRIPATKPIAHREHALLGARFFFVAAGAAKTAIKPMRFDGIQECDRLRRITRAGWVSQAHSTGSNRLLHAGHDQPLTQLGNTGIPISDHFLKIVSGIDMHQGKRKPTRPECFFSQTEHNRGVLASGEQQDRIFALGNGFAQDMDPLGFQVVQMIVGEFDRRGGHRHPCWVDPAQCLSAV